MVVNLVAGVADQFLSFLDVLLALVVVPWHLVFLRNFVERQRLAVTAHERLLVLVEVALDPFLALNAELGVERLQGLQLLQGRQEMDLETSEYGRRA